MRNITIFPPETILKERWFLKILALPLPFVPLSQSPLLSDEDLYYGFFYFINQFNSNPEKDSQELLLEAEKHFSIHAVSVLNAQDIKQIVEAIQEKKVLASELIDAILKRVMRLTEKHLTPGYIMLATTYLWLGRMFGESGKIDQMRTAFEGALINMEIARKLEPYSEKAIHNAYATLGLKKSNSDQIEVISDLLAHFYKLIIRTVKGSSLELHFCAPSTLNRLYASAARNSWVNQLATAPTPFCTMPR